MAIVLPPPQTTWSRLEPRCEALDTQRALSAELYDPFWMLARQMQLGELRGEDTGSIAYVRLAYKKAPLKELVFRQGTAAEVTVAVDAHVPLEKQMLQESTAVDFGMQVELGEMFFQLLEQGFSSVTLVSSLKAAFQSAKPLPDRAGLSDSAFNPVDVGTLSLWALAKGRIPDGVEVHTLAKTKTIPANVAALLPDTTQQQTLLTIYDDLVAFADATFGAMGTQDPSGWDPYRLEYDIQAKFGEGGSTSLRVTPADDGAVDWTAFDVAANSGDAFSSISEEVKLLAAPAHVRFPGMPAPRYWDFEKGELPLADLDIHRTEIAKLLLVDLPMIYGIDWLVMPLDVEAGHAIQIASLVICDVFGRKTAVERAGKTGESPPARWTMFSHADASGAPGDFLVVGQCAGSAQEWGPVLEQVRFARDEMANLAWGIEAITPTGSGEPRRGSERDAAVDDTTPPATTTTADLRYQIESKIPVHWIPLLPQQGTSRTMDLVRGVTHHPKGIVGPVGKVLKPSSIPTGAYRIGEEGIPREGVSVERLVLRARSADGNFHLWTERRKRFGAGETESGLRFDAALPVEK